MSDTPDLSSAVAGWKPEPLDVTGRLDAWPVAAFTAALDLSEGPGPGDPLPPLWHWFHLLDHPRRSGLGDDGHPAEGRFVPPLPHRRRMIAGGRLRVSEPMRVGEEVIRRSELASVEVKTGRSGQMVFVTTRHKFTRTDGTPLLSEEQDVVYRSQPPGQTRGLATAPADVSEPPARWRFETPTDAALLFRVSALTYNTHRIHYDEPYVTAVEGYPGLLVHGPLLALLLLEIPRRDHPDAVVTEFDYRLTRPVFVGATVVTRGDVGAHDDRLVLAGAAAGAPDSITGTAVLRR
jgi:3-methylfumaryl-CoA hydratase